MSADDALLFGNAPRATTTIRHRGAVLSALRVRRAQIGLAMTALLVLVALIGPAISPYTATEFVAPPFSAPSSKAVLGTDYLGHDVLSRALAGGQSVLFVSVTATALGVLMGTAIGLSAATAGRIVDEVLMRAMDVLLAFPQILLVLVTVSVIGPKTWLVIAVVGLTTAPRVARVVRGAAAAVVSKNFVRASEAMGERRWRLLGSELLPNVASPLLAEAALRLTIAIGLVAGLSFLGLSTDPNGADWGRMVQENYSGVTIQPWGVIVPSLAIAMITVAASLIADGISRSIVGIERSPEAL